MNLFNQLNQDKFEELFYPNIPFENDKLGFLRGYLLSVKMLFLKPRLFFRIMHINKGFNKPLYFALINIFIAVLASNLYMFFDLIDTPKEQFANLLARADEYPAEVKEALVNMDSQLPEYLFNFGTILQHGTGLWLNLLILITGYHLGLLILKVADNGFQATWRVICYSSVALLLNLFPLDQIFVAICTACIGWFIAFIGTVEAHELNSKRSIIAALSMPLTLLIVVLPMLLMS